MGVHTSNGVCSICGSKAVAKGKCSKCYIKDWREKNSEHVKNYRLKNKNKIQVYQKEYRNNNRKYLCKTTGAIRR